LDQGPEIFTFPGLLHGLVSRNPQAGPCSMEDEMDSLSKRAQPDRGKINLGQPHELKYWTRALRVSEEEIRRAIDKVGNSAAAVRKELGLIGASRN